MKKHITVGVGDLLGCGYYRCAMPYQHLVEYGFDVHLTNKLTVELLNKSDVLVLQRQHHPGVLETAKDYKKRGGKLVYELDDYFHQIPHNNPARRAYMPGGEELRNINEFLKLADLVTVSTPSLASQFSKLNDNIKVCYNSIDPDCLIDKFPATFTPNQGKFRLGWAGSATHVDNLLTIIKPVSEIMRELPNVEFVFLGVDYRKLFPLDIQKRCIFAGHTFPLKNGKGVLYDPHANPVVEYYKLLIDAKLDAAIAPLTPCIFNNCKSFIKLVEYGFCQVPFVATNFGPYSQYVGHHSKYTRNSQVGLLANTNSEWKRELRDLITDEALRSNLRHNNYKNVLDNHNIRFNVRQWQDALASIDVFPDSEQGSYEENIANVA